MGWGLDQWQPQNYFQSYAHSKLFDNGYLNFEKVKRYAPLFGLRERDFGKVRKEQEVAQLLFKKQKEAFCGVDPTKQTKEPASLNLSEHIRLQRNKGSGNKNQVKNGANLESNGHYGEDTQERLSLMG